MTSGRIGIFIVALGLAVMMSAYPVAAAPAPVLSYKDSQIPPSVSARKIALLFNRLANTMPDFENWAQRLQAEKIRSGVAPDLLATPETGRALRSEFDLLIPQETIFVATPVTLSSYSELNGGYIIPDFTDTTYFSFPFLDRNYALIAQGLVDRQWVGATRAQARLLEKARAETPEGTLVVVLQLQPRSADASAPLDLDGVPHYLMSALIDKIQIYAPKTGMLVWESQPLRKPEAVDVDPELLQLYQ